MRHGGTGVAGTNEAEILGIADRNHALDCGETVSGFVTRSVVDDDDLETGALRLRCE
jgi:hypothetical protein